MKSRRHAWSIDDTAILVDMARAGSTDIEIGRQLGLSASAIGRKRRALKVAAGLPSRLRIFVARRTLPCSGRKSRP